MNKVLVIDPRKMGSIKVLDKYNDIVKEEDKASKTVITDKEFHELQRKSNEIEQQLVIKDVGECFIIGEKDIKQCTMTFAPYNSNKVDKKLIQNGLDYTFNKLGMETIFINVEQDDQKLMNLLELYDFINLGEVNGKITFLKEKEEEKIHGIMLNESSFKH